jgi:hypothetical protein
MPIHTFVYTFPCGFFLAQFSNRGLEMDWLYIWSPRYRFFHECLYSVIKDLSGFQVTPVFAEQHLFNPIQTSSSHFFAGIAIKIYVIRNYIEKNIGKHFFFTDVDLVVLPEFKAADLDSYKENDITVMKECHPTLNYNIGCMLIHCSPKTLDFFDKVLMRIRTEKLLDQDAFEQEATSFDGVIGLFDSTEFLQSNMLSDTSNNMKIIQCLTSESNKTEIFLEKIFTIQAFYDISQVIQYLPEDVQEALDTETRMSES